MQLKTISIKKLGQILKKTKSEVAFIVLYERIKPGILKSYEALANRDTELLEDCYNEAMISIWKDIGSDTIDVDKFSISTMIYLKTKQNLIKNFKSNKKINSMNSLDAENADSYIESIINKSQEKIEVSIEDKIIEKETTDLFWSKIKDVNFFYMIDEYYNNNLKYKEIASKYNVDIQTVKNRIFHAKKKIKDILENE